MPEPVRLTNAVVEFISGASSKDVPSEALWPGVSIKLYPCGVLGHPMMDAMRRLVIGYDVQPDQIRASRVRAGSNILKPLRYAIASNELEAKFCPAFMVGAIARRGRLKSTSSTTAFVQSAPVQAMMQKVELVLDPAIEAKGWERIRSTVEVDFEDGRTLVEHADERSRGGPDLPFTRAELYEKFSDCASLVLPESRVGETFRMVESLEDLSDINELVHVMTDAARRAAASR